MKKLLNKFRFKKRHQTTNSDAASSLRITNETVAEHRERILAGGRKFKYPLQYPKYRIVTITVLLVLLVLGVLSAITWWRLYSVQDTSKIMLRITQVLPVPVGAVDSHPIRYSDYLSELSSALHYLSTKEAVNFSSDDGKRQLAYQKRLALNKAIESTYVEELAAQKHIKISDKEVNDFIATEIKNNNLGVTEDMYKQVIQDYYDWTFDDYKDSVKLQLLKKKVVAAIDVEGRQKIDALLQSIQGGKDFAQVAKDSSEDPLTETNGGDVGFVSKGTDDPNGLMAAAMKLQPGQVSGVIDGVDGFYLVKLLEKRDNDYHIAKILVTYKTFAKQLEDLRKAAKIKEYISVPQTVSPTNQ